MAGSGARRRYGCMGAGSGSFMVLIIFLWTTIGKGYCSYLAWIALRFSRRLNHTGPAETGTSQNGATHSSARTLRQDMKARITLRLLRCHSGSWIGKEYGCALRLWARKQTGRSWKYSAGTPGALGSSYRSWPIISGLIKELMNDDWPR